MSIGIAEIFLLIAVGVYIFILVDRICKCFEYCALQKSLGNAYSRMNSNWLDDLVKKKLSANKES